TGGRPADELLEGVEVDRELPEAPVGPGEDFVFDRAPLGELAQIVDDALRVGAEIMRAVIVQQHAGFVVMIVSVAADVIAPVDDKAGLAKLIGNPFRQHGPGKPSADDEKIKSFHNTQPARAATTASILNVTSK